MSDPSPPTAPQTLPSVPGDALHGAVARPPTLAWNGQQYRGATLADVRHPTMQDLPGIVSVVRHAHFVGVVAVSARHARQGIDSLVLSWQPERLRASHSQASMAGDAYRWSPSVFGTIQEEAVAWCTGHQVTVWLPFALQPAYGAMVTAELAALLRVPPSCVTLVAIAASAAPGRPVPTVLEVLDAAADAALLSATVRRPVRVPLRRADAPHTLALQAHGLSDGTPPRPTLHAATSPTPQAPQTPQNAQGQSRPPAMPGSGPHATQGWQGWQANTVWAVRPSLARLCAQPHQAHALPYPAVHACHRIPSHEGAAPLSHAGPEELNAALVFAQESEADERARGEGMDPLAWRLANTPEGPGRALIRQVAAQAHWYAHEGERTAEPEPAQPLQEDGLLHGRGFAAAGMDHPCGLQEWSAWVVEVAIDPGNGQVDIERVVVGHDAGSLDAAHATIESDDDQYLAIAQDLVQEPRTFDDWEPSADLPVTTTTAGTLRTASDPKALVSSLQATTLRTGSIVTWPAAAAIANAIYDASGVRMRTAPFNAEDLRAALGAPPKGTQRGKLLKRGSAWLAAGCAVVAGAAVTAWPAKPAIAPIDAPDLSIFSTEAIERGRLVAAAGDCIVCHTAPGGAPNAGGLALETPFGVIYTTNITPDKETGIGRWSYTAFERAMREGVHRDGRQLYPAFPYTAFAKMSDADIQALYGYLMSQEPVHSTPPETRLAFPYNLRPTLAGWNLLFHDNTVYQPVPEKSLEWNRGAYLVQGAGHCAACHSPRNALGAEKSGLRNYLAGGEAEGWEAPALNRLASGPVPWTAEDLFQYLRTGHSARHGVAAGPMAPVIHGLAEIPESDVRAIATYLMDLPGQQTTSTTAPTATATATATTPLPALQPDAADAAIPHMADSALRLTDWFVEGERIYQAACAACHGADSGPTLFGVKPLMGTNTNIHASAPDNLIQVILQGIQAPADAELGYMPGFKEHLSDAQVESLVRYLRAEFAPDQPTWSAALPKDIARIRTQGEHAATLHAQPPQSASITPTPETAQTAEAPH
ncbi:cytochrome c [Corticibacter populi]|uniref:Cytochrome c n=1 Tax=Corticibacter populi TaxID=1550736 RepID=A0A3M6QRL4_9BURK|nr:cytochrome c [Corticibacter populi]RMX05687.1 cytochrome c [Corticibacter populi]RZS31023.1 nicotinate dehydrogenase subunit B [Corticibacter populi]